MIAALGLGDDELPAHQLHGIAGLKEPALDQPPLASGCSTSIAQPTSRGSPRHPGVAVCACRCTPSASCWLAVCRRDRRALSRAAAPRAAGVRPTGGTAAHRPAHARPDSLPRERRGGGGDTAA
jgi:hypothetical protein